MNSVNTPMDQLPGAWELQPGGVIAPQYMQSTEELKQRSHRCALATTNLSASLALAATLCIDAGSHANDAAIMLLVGSVAAAEMAGAYADLTRDGTQENMYEVQYTEPIAVSLPHATLAFEAVLQDFTTGLLQLNIALHLVHLSYRRVHATMEELENNRNDPEGALSLNAKLFSTLQRQALWRNLKLCTMLHNDLLLLTPCVNLLWHQFRLRVPSQARFSEHDVRETLTNIWLVRAQDIAAYHLSAFGITDCAGMLHVLTQQGRTLTDPVLLVQEEWHKSTYLLTQSFQHALDTFYPSDMLRLLNDNANG
jgi:hypothetical protein